MTEIYGNYSQSHTPSQGECNSPVDISPSGNSWRSLIHSVRCHISRCQLFASYESLPDVLHFSIIAYMDHSSLCHFRGVCKYIWKDVSKLAVKQNIIPLLPGPFAADLNKMGSGHVLCPQTMWRNHNMLCETCELELPDKHCFTCNLAFHSGCLSAQTLSTHSQEFLCPHCRDEITGPFLGFCQAISGDNGMIFISGGRHMTNYERNFDIYSYSPTDCRWTLKPCGGSRPDDPLNIGFDRGCVVDENGIGCFWYFQYSDYRYTIASSVTAPAAVVPSIDFYEAHILDPTRCTWSRLEFTGNAPPQKVEYAICHHPSYNGLMVHGGWMQSRGLSDELHWLDIGSRAWVQLKCSHPVPVPGKISDKSSKLLDESKSNTGPGSGPGPSPRSAHTLTLVGSQMWLFGGLGVDSGNIDGGTGIGTEGTRPSSTSSRKCKIKPLNDVYSLDISISTVDAPNDVAVLAVGKAQSSKNSPPPSSSSCLPSSSCGVYTVEWKFVRTSGKRPARRSGHSAMAIGPHLLICGGANGNVYMSCTEVYVLHTNSKRWSSLMPSRSLTLTPRLRPTLVALTPQGDEILIFGGGLLQQGQLDPDELKSDGLKITIRPFPLS